jgi:hypothetical protein
MLTDAHKKQRMVCALAFLDQCHKYGDEFLDDIIRVTGDEIWVSFVNVETKEQSKQWMHTHIHQTRQKSLKKCCLPARKLLAILFWDRKEVLTVEFMEQGITITPEVYCKTLRKLHWAIQIKRHGMLTYSILVVLLHDNARPHTAASTRTLPEYFNWELSDNPPYSPDLALSDCHLCIYLKNSLRSQRFNNNEELMEGFKTWMNSQAADFIDISIQKLIHRYDKCLNSSSDYAEKQLKYVRIFCT